MIDLINKLADNKIHLFIESGLLKISTEEKEVNPAILEEIRSNKEALILYLSDQDST
ncbi:hypothetical protein, partial [[Flexibacter] sp. ATCC 35103]|uniref:TubC N-terminal docking domain-related protein n=1 Tax=[Flexibacter] sp. ATCC 35103 TaxID=1937528 RepID=UPI0013F5E67B